MKRLEHLKKMGIEVRQRLSEDRGYVGGVFVFAVLIIMIMALRWLFFN